MHFSHCTVLTSDRLLCTCARAPIAQRFLCAGSVTGDLALGLVRPGVARTLPHTHCTMPNSARVAWCARMLLLFGAAFVSYLRAFPISLPPPPLLSLRCPPPPQRALAGAQRRSRIEADIDPASFPLSPTLLPRPSRYELLRLSTVDHWWRCTLMHPDHFLQLLQRIRQYACMPQLRCGLSDEDCLLLLIEWLCSYPTLARLAFDFGVHESTAWRVIRIILPAAVVALRGSANDLASPEKRAQLLGQCAAFPTCLGIIDCTAHRIERPEADEEFFYRRDRRCHSVTTQLIVNFAGKPIHVSSGYPGASHDLRVFKMSKVEELLGPGELLLGDQGYLRGPFISPYDFQDGDPMHRYFNKRLSHFRVRVEQSIRTLKRWRALSSRWRSNLPSLGMSVLVVAGICAEQAEEYAENMS